MGFNLQPTSGPFTLAPGASIRVWVWLGGGGGAGQPFGSDKGAQWIMANPLDLPASISLPAALQVSDFAKVRDFPAGLDGDVFVIDLTRTVVQYQVTVTNIGSVTTRFTVQGGGNT